MRKNHVELKHKHEEAVIRSFLSVLSEEYSSNLKFSRVGDPKLHEPDGICTDGTGIELVGVYENEYIAKRLWGEARGSKNLKLVTDYRLYSEKNLEQMIWLKLQKLRDGHYNLPTTTQSRLILLCNCSTPLFTDEDAESFIGTHTPFRTDDPLGKYYDDAWILWEQSMTGKTMIRRIEQ